MFDLENGRKHDWKSKWFQQIFGEKWPGAQCYSESVDWIVHFINYLTIQDEQMTKNKEKNIIVCISTHYFRLKLNHIELLLL